MRRRVTPTLINTGGGGGTYIPNIISYWNMNGNANDVVGANNGTALDSATFTSGLISDSANFTANAFSRINVPDSDTLSFGNGTTDSPFSISLWVNFSSVTDAWFINKRGTSPTTEKEYQFIYFSSSLRITLFDQSAGDISIIKILPFTPSVSTWYHCAMTYDGSGFASGINLYLDLATGGTATENASYVAMENNTADLIMGKANFSSGFSLNGLLDEVAIFDRVLTLSEITELYNRGVSGTPLFP